MRHKIVDEILVATKRTAGNEFLYDGLLMEAGSSSPTDIDEHLTIKELRELVKSLSIFRKICPPKGS